MEVFVSVYGPKHPKCIVNRTDVVEDATGEWSAIFGVNASMVHCRKPMRLASGRLWNRGIAGGSVPLVGVCKPAALKDKFP